MELKAVKYLNEKNFVRNTRIGTGAVGVSAIGDSYNYGAGNYDDKK